MNEHECENGQEHDWRVDPSFMYVDGRYRAVCAACGKTKQPVGEPWRPTSNNPKDWRRLEE